MLRVYGRVCVYFLLVFAYGSLNDPALLIKKVIFPSVNCLINNEGAFSIKKEIYTCGRLMRLIIYVFTVLTLQI